MATKKTTTKENGLGKEVVTDIKEIQALVKKVIDNGANTIEDVHQAIAKLPLKYLQKIDVIKDPAKDVMDVQEKTIGYVYELIRDINQKVDDFAKDVLKRF